MFPQLKNIWKDQQGQAMTEYAIVVGCGVLLGFTSFYLFTEVLVKIDQAIVTIVSLPIP